MRWRTWIQVVLHVVIWSFLAYGIFIYATTIREMSFVNILGSTEKDLSLPVFAQFVVAQTLLFDRPIYATELAIPLYVPNDALPIKIELYQDNTLITWWWYPFAQEANVEGTSVARLRFIIPTLLRGNVEVRFDGSSIIHDLQDRAPRLFTETSDGAYPHGNYRIAENEKQGDVSMELIEQKTNYELFIQNIQTNPLGKATQIMLWLCVMFLLGCLPSIIMTPFFKHN